MNKILDIIRNILSVFKSGEGTYSCKRVTGMAIIVVILRCYWHCSNCGTQLPLATDVLVISACTMMGIDTVAKVAGNLKKNETDKS